ncbi:MAG: peptide-methionine (S)-S-oxide reductase, partial [Rickettsiales bacterium]|nr:peptide-methionine (S)-S-oxide reductase [Rickettsiales bacterium]
ADRQGNDRGSQYRSAIFYTDEAQKATAEKVMQAANASGKFPAPIVTQLTPASVFYPAEKEHQDYLKKYPDGYTCHFIRPGWKFD